MKIKVRTVQEIALIFYLVAVCAYQLGTGFDASIIRGTFLFLMFSLFLNVKHVKFNLHVIWLIIFWCFYFISMLWARNTSDTLYYLNTFVQIFGLSIFLSSYIENIKDIKKILLYLLIAMFYSVVVIIKRTPLYVWGTERLGFVIGIHSNNLGIRLAISSIISFYFYTQSIKNNKKMTHKLFFFSLFILFLVISLFTGSKKALFAIALCVFLFEMARTKGLKLFIRTIIIIISIAVSINFILSNPKLYSVIGKRLERTFLTLSKNVSINNEDSSLIERQYYIKKGISLFSNHPIIGYGGNNFATYMREIGYSHIAYSHNNYVELLCTLGAVGFLIYYAFWIYLLFQLWQQYKNTKKDFILLFLVLIVCQLIIAFGDVDYISDFTSIILALSYNVIKIEKSKGDNYELR